MKLVYVAGKSEKEPKRLSKKEQYHANVVEFLERQTALDRIAAREMFRDERAELNTLINQAINAGYTQEEINNLNS